MRDSSSSPRLTALSRSLPKIFVDMAEWWETDPETASWYKHTLSLFDDSSSDLEYPVLKLRAELLGTTEVRLRLSLADQCVGTDRVDQKGGARECTEKGCHV